MDHDWQKTAREACKTFNADRMTVYRVSEDGNSLVAVVQSNLEDYGAIKVRVESQRSIAGYVGANRTLVNIGDAYDEKELAPLRMQRKMFMAVDERTGYRTHQVLAAPVIKDGKLVGVVELLNRLDKQRFPKSCEQEIEKLCESLAPAL